MNEREALLRAVCENPDEDTPRLVFADWLQENGNESDQARAEFIRVQIALARANANPQEAGLKTREQTLLTKFGDSWLELIRPHTSPGWGDPWWEFGRGFVERMSVDGEEGGTFFDAAEDLLRLYPLQTLWFPYLQDYEPISRWPGLRRITELMLMGSRLAGDMGIGELFRSPHAAGIRVFHLNGYDDNGHLDLESIRELAGHTALHGLRHLDLEGNWSTWQHGSTEWVRVLVGAQLLAQLDRLDLGGTYLRGEGAEIIANAPQLANLKHLDLSHNEIGDRGARALLESPHLGRLQVLDLRGIGEIGYQEDAVTDATRTKLVERFGDRVRFDPK